MASSSPIRRTSNGGAYSTFPISDNLASGNKADNPPRSALSVVAGITIALLCGIMIGRVSMNWTDSGRFVVPKVTENPHGKATVPVDALLNPKVQTSLDEDSNLVVEATYVTRNPPHAIAAAFCPSGFITGCECKVQFPSCAGAYAAYVPHMCRCVFYGVSGPCPNVPHQKVVVATTCSK